MAIVNGTSGNDLITTFTVPGTTDSADNVFAGDGNDTVRGAGGNDLIDGWNGDDFLEGNDGDDFILGFNGQDYLNGGGGNDQLYGENDDDSIDGHTGNDTAYGGNGNDSIWGWSGQDYLNGGGGNDRLLGENGNDILTGGLGADDFVIASPADGVDQITDFDFAEGDKVVIVSFGFGTTSTSDFTSTFNASTGVEKLFFTPAGGGSTLIAELTNLSADFEFIPNLYIDFI